VSQANQSSSGAQTQAEQLLANVPSCSNSVIDHDGDGWGYESGESCLIRGSGSASATTVVAPQTSQSTPATNTQFGTRPVGVSFNNSTVTG